MKKWKVIRKVCLVLLCVILLLPCSTYTMVVHAEEEITNEVDEENENRFSKGSPWLEGADDSIYSNGVDTKEDDQEIEPKDPGMVEKYFAELLRNVASSLISLLENTLGATLDSIIYGRVGSGKPNSVNIFGFELRSGNPYGVTGAVCYSLLRGMAYVYLGIFFAAMLAKSLWSGHTAQSRERIKSSIFSTAMKFSILVLMPFLFDVALYVRDVALYGVKEVTGQMITGGASLSLSQTFLINAERTGRFIDAVMYLGTVLLTFYFAIIYIALAIDILIAFVTFPILCLMHSSKRDLLGNWIMSVLSDILTPLLDAILLLVPLLTSMMLGDVIRGIAVIQLAMCILIIPARNKIKSLLGIQNNERGGFLSAMGLLAMGRMIAGKAKGAVQRISGIYSDAQKSRMHGELAEVDEEERSSLLGGYDRNGQENRILSDMEDREKAENNFGGNKDSADMDSYDGSSSTEVPDVEETVGYDNGQEDPSYSDDIEDVEEKRDSLVTGDVSRKDGFETESGKDDSYETPTDTAIPMTKNDALRDIDRTMNNMQQKIDDLKVRKADYQNQEKQLARKMLDYEKGSDEYKELEKERADAALGAAETAQKIEEQSRKLNEMRQQQKELKGSEGGPTPTQFDEARARILCKRANIDNFEQPEFRHVLSNEQMKKLYRNRAIANGAKGVAAVIGATAGATMLGGGSVFMGAGAIQAGTVAGVTAGAAVGNTAVGAGIVGTRFIRDRYKGTGNTGASTPTIPPIQPNPTVPGTPTKPVSPTVTGPIPTSVQPNPHVQQTVGETIVEQKVSPNVRDNETFIMPETTQQRKVRVEIEEDSVSAIKQVLTSAGGLRNSSAVQALQQANIETEKYILAAKELEGHVLTKQQELEKRTELQTEKLTDEIMKRLSNNPDYEPGTENYAEAKASVSEKVRAIIERQNRDLF